MTMQMTGEEKFVSAAAERHPTDIYYYITTLAGAYIMRTSKNVVKAEDAYRQALRIPAIDSRITRVTRIDSAYIKA